MVKMKRESDMKTQLKERTEHRKGRPSVMSSGKEASVCFSLCVPELQSRHFVKAGKQKHK